MAARDFKLKEHPAIPRGVPVMLIVLDGWGEQVRSLCTCCKVQLMTLTRFFCLVSSTRLAPSHLLRFGAWDYFAANAASKFARMGITACANICRACDAFG
jgi:hypothetical protein